MAQLYYLASHHFNISILHVYIISHKQVRKPFVSTREEIQYRNYAHGDGAARRQRLGHEERWERSKAPEPQSSLLSSLSISSTFSSQLASHKGWSWTLEVKTGQTFEISSPLREVKIGMGWRVG